MYRRRAVPQWDAAQLAGSFRQFVALLGRLGRLDSPISKIPAADQRSGAGVLTGIILLRRLQRSGPKGLSGRRSELFAESAQAVLVQHRPADAVVGVQIGIALEELLI